jgi:hypothetical protein
MLLPVRHRQALLPSKALRTWLFTRLAPVALCALLTVIGVPRWAWLFFFSIGCVLRLFRRILIIALLRGFFPGRFGTRRARTVAGILLQALTRFFQIIEQRNYSAKKLKKCLTRFFVFFCDFGDIWLVVIITG